MISDKKLFDKIKWSPYGYWNEEKVYVEKRHEGQIQILDAWNGGAEEIAVEAGTRFGKTQIASYIGLKEFTEKLDEIRQGKRESVKGWIVAPTYELTKKIFENLIRWFLKIHPESANAITYRPFPQIKLAEGVWIQGKSATEPNSLLGEELDFLIGDECPRINKDIWMSYLWPRLTSRRGRSVLIGSPFGRTWHHDEYLKLKKIGAGFNFPTNANPYFPKEKWEEAKKLLPERVFNQEFRAMALADAAAVFRGIDAIIKDNALADVKKDHRYVMGVDLGKHEDFTVLVVIDKDNNNVVYFDRFKQIDYPFQKARIKATAERYNNARIIIDSTGVGEPIFDDLRREKLFVDDFKFSNKSKKGLIEKLSIFIEQLRVFIPDNEILIDELKSFGYKLSEAGVVIYRAPQGLHDDCVISLALAVWGLLGAANPMTPLQRELAKAETKKRPDNFI